MTDKHCLGKKTLDTKAVGLRTECISLLYFFAENDLTKVRDEIVYEGVKYNCDEFINVNTGPGVFCNCPFLACSGSQECNGNSLNCYIVNKNYDYTDMKDEDCDCKSDH